MTTSARRSCRWGTKARNGNTGTLTWGEQAGPAPPRPFVSAPAHRRSTVPPFHRAFMRVAARLLSSSNEKINRVELGRMSTPDVELRAGEACGTTRHAGYAVSQRKRKGSSRMTRAGWTTSIPHRPAPVPTLRRRPPDVAAAHIIPRPRTGLPRSWSLVGRISPTFTPSPRGKEKRSEPRLRTWQSFGSSRPRPRPLAHLVRIPSLSHAAFARSTPGFLNNGLQGRLRGLQSMFTLEAPAALRNPSSASYTTS